MPIPVVDLFAGPGGLNEGFSSVVGARGTRVFKTAISVEMDEYAHRTLELRALFRALEAASRLDRYVAYLRGEITREALFDGAPTQAKAARVEALRATMGASESGDAEIEHSIAMALGPRGTGNFVLIGGPPCQAYSLVGRARRRNEDRAVFESDPKHRLYREYLRIVNRFKPAVFVMENVPGLLSAQLAGESTFQMICRDLAAAGYELHSLNPKPELFADGIDTPKRFVVRAEEFGVPQARARVFILGLRKDLKLRARALMPGPSSKTSVDDVLSGLPPIRSKLSDQEDSGERWRAAIAEIAQYKWRSAISEEFAALIRNEATRLDPMLPVGRRFVEVARGPKKLSDWYSADVVGGVSNHNSRGHMASDLRRYFFWAAYALVHERSPSLADVPPYLRPDHENVKGDARELPFADRFRVQVATRPSTTITSHISKDGHYYIHPDMSQSRSLSVREAARLQTFPDTYFFEGPVTEQYKQVGNAVPPYLARQIGRVVANILE